MASLLINAVELFEDTSYLIRHEFFLYKSISFLNTQFNVLTFIDSKAVSNSSISVQKRSLPKPIANINNSTTTQPAKQMKCDYLEKEIFGMYAFWTFSWQS